MTSAVIFSVLALVLSVVSLVWQAWSWFHSGPVLRVKTANVFLVGQNPGVGEHYVTIEAVNTGRAPAMVTSWGIEMPDKRNLVLLQPYPFSPSLPTKIEPHSSETFYLHADRLREHRQQTGTPFKRMRPWIKSGIGQKKYAKGGVPL